MKDLIDILIVILKIAVFIFCIWGCFDFIIWATEHIDANLIELINNLTISKTLRVMWWAICIKWATNINYTNQNNIKIYK